MLEVTPNDSEGVGALLPDVDGVAPDDKEEVDDKVAEAVAEKKGDAVNEGEAPTLRVFVEEPLALLVALTWALLTPPVRDEVRVWVWEGRWVPP